MKIAVPVDEDKSTIVKRTGHGAFFAIFEDGVFVDVVKNNHGNGNHGEGHSHEHHHDHADENHHSHKEYESDEEHVKSHKKDISGIAGCDLILVQAIGEHMQEALKSMNIKVKKIRQKDGVTAEEAVTNFLKKTTKEI
jgi:predicted Fe-Mo cluster-binding NifX family protein